MEEIFTLWPVIGQLSFCSEKFLPKINLYCRWVYLLKDTKLTLDNSLKIKNDNQWIGRWKITECIRLTPMLLSLILWSWRNSKSGEKYPVISYHRGCSVFLSIMKILRGRYELDILRLRMKLVSLYDKEK